jgi:aspartyl-tRNA(Asn)/glutamyl-tRNA(Gln) amidotransferase subunit C
LTKLCRIECSQEEKEKLFEKLSNILSYMDLLGEVGTQDITPCNQVIETLNNIMREDKVGETLSREEFLANSPSHIGGMIKIPPVLKTAT